VVNLKRRGDRRARMERLLPAAWDVQFTSDWDGPMDGQTIDTGNLPGFGLYPWEVRSDNPWWSRPLKLGEIGCAVSHWMCWQKAAADAADPALILEDDAVLTRHAPNGSRPGWRGCRRSTRAGIWSTWGGGRSTARIVR
jgi:collagen beta-1,O-galactosyltransferase